MTSATTELGHGHTDAWGKDADGGCEFAQDLGRTTWTLCRRPTVAIGTQADGTKRCLCARHVGSAKRQARLYHDSFEFVVGLTGKVIAQWVPPSGGNRGYMDVIA